MKEAGFGMVNWLEEYKCPACGYRSCTTNVCRTCPKTPADEPARILVWCHNHNCAHTIDGKPVLHRSLNMYATGREVKGGIGRRTSRKLKKNRSLENYDRALRWNCLQRAGDNLCKRKIPEWVWFGDD